MSRELRIVRKIESIVHQHHGELVHFADVSKYQRVSGGAVPTELLPNAKTAIVHTLKIKTMYEVYGKWYIVSLNKHLSLVNAALCSYLESKGFFAKDIPEGAHDRKTLIGKLSFRQLGVLAGLGHIGKNQMLINDQLGSAFNLGVVLTSFSYHSKACSSLACSGCDICVKRCPTGALSAKGYDRFICKARREILGKSCGLRCVWDCPLNEEKYIN